MARVLISMMAVCVLFAALPDCVSAVDLRHGNTVVVPKKEATADDLMVAGQSVRLEGRVGGDVAAAGKGVSVSGPVRDSVLLAGQDVLVTGRVGNDAWLVGRSVVLAAPVADNAYVAGSNVLANKDSAVGRDLLAAGNDVRLMGKVGRNVRVSGGTVALRGTIDGNVYARATKLRLLKGTLIRGNLHYTSPSKLTMAPGAKVIGKVYHSIPPKERMWPVFWSGFSWWLGSLIAAILFGIVLVALFPVRSMAAAETVRRRFWLSLAIGLTALVVVPMACVLAMITLVGFPLALAVIAIYLVLLYAAGMFVALAIGRAVLGRRAEAQPMPIPSLILGLVILSLVELIPLFGGMVKFVALITGLGALLVSWWTGRQLAPGPAPITVPPPGAGESPDSH